MQAPSPLRAIGADDLAIHHDAVDPGPHPALRAVIGVLLGLAAGAAAALLLPRRPPTGTR